MKKLEDLPRQNIFETPDGYFDQLPGIIQSRVMQQQKSANQVSWGIVLKYAFPILLLAGAGIFWFNANKSGNAEAELAALNTEQLTFFLNDTDVSTEELIETISWSDTDLQNLEDEIYAAMDVTGEEMDNVLDEYGYEL